MSYLVLARKSRPQTLFRGAQVVGQKAVARTLQNRLEQSKNNQEEQ
ncbi:MAG: hypothetical protein SD837_04125 [Candidatus Electrothrix scaldis]|nr:MAG: hypothetical protein SD837_04125 [Candidatus Electrothrix sp. GW3-3]